MTKLAIVLGVPIALLSVGPQRDQTIALRPVF